MRGLVFSQLYHSVALPDANRWNCCDGDIAPQRAQRTQRTSSVLSVSSVVPNCAVHQGRYAPL